MHRVNAEFWFTNFENAWIHSLKRSTFKSQSAFLVSEKCVLRIWLWKNAGRGVYATPKFWHKIRDSKKTVDYLLNRSRVVLGKSFLRLSDVLTVVYTTYSLSQFRLNAEGKLKYNISWIILPIEENNHILVFSTLRIFGEVIISKFWGCGDCMKNWLAQLNIEEP